MLLALLMAQVVGATDLTAEGWQWIANGVTGDEFYVQPFKGPREPYPKTWYRQVAADRSVVQLMEVNCETWQSRSIQGSIVWTTSEGEVRQDGITGSEWSYIAPNTISEAMAEHVCGD